MNLGDEAFKWLWANDSVGNFTASAVFFVLGGRWVWKKHLKPHLDHHRQQLQALHDKVDAFSQTPPGDGSETKTVSN